MTPDQQRVAVHETKEFLRERATAYRLALGSPAGQSVLRDLAKFCRANTTCFHPDPRMHAVLEGRREVWLRLQQHLNLDPAQLYEILGGVHIDIPEGEDHVSEP